MKFIITKADNGFIVKFQDTGLGTFKELYVKPLMVFQSFEDMMKHIKKICEQAR